MNDLFDIYTGSIKKKRNPCFVFNNFQSTEAYKTILDLF